jgi:ornithine cyclodeaminase/alanine dehydrogenase-like protein (mu-crystallin family)
MKSDVVSWRDHAGGRVEDKYCVEPGLYCGLIFLLDTNTGEPLAFINDGYLQHMRVGALAALGVKYLAKSRASVLGMLGAGGMAHSHLLAFAAVRDIERVQVYSPTKSHREAYAAEMQEQLGIQVIPCESPKTAVKGADIMAACTNSMRPIVFAEMLEPGMHLAQVSAEWAPDVFPRIDLGVGGDPSSQVITGVPIDDSHGFPSYLAGDYEALQQAWGAGNRYGTGGGHGSVAEDGSVGGFHGRTVSLVDLIAGSGRGRENDDQISSSGGVRGGGGKQGLQFVTVSSLVYDRAKEAGLGREIPTDWFLQNIRN